MGGDDVPRHVPLMVHAFVKGSCSGLSVAAQHHRLSPAGISLDSDGSCQGRCKEVRQQKPCSLSRKKDP